MRFAPDRRRLSGSVLAIAAVCAAALAAGPQASATVPDERPAFGAPIPLVPPAGFSASVGVTPTLPQIGDAELRGRLEMPGLTVGGERLRLALLRQFYAAYGYEKIWDRRPAQAEALLRAVRMAGDHGLDPDLFHAALLRNPALSPVERDLVLSSAFLGYADALARGAVPVEMRTDDEDLSPEPVDVAAVVHRALQSADPGAVLEGLAPQTPAYRALRQALRNYRASGYDAGLPGGVRSGDRVLRDLSVNLERLRWLPRNLPADRVWVNAATAQLVLYRNHRPVFTTRVIVGETDKQTPEFQTPITGIVLNPPWNVPYSIVKAEILPKLARDPDYLSRRRMVLKPDGGIQQQPGPGGTALGHIKFDMPNPFDVYLHDTPMKNLFARDNRRLSHGCVRVQNPRELAAMLLQQPVEAVSAGIASGATTRRPLPAPITSFMVYHTAFYDDETGAIAYSPDVYNRDEAIWRKMRPLRQAPVAHNEPASQRRS